MWWRIIHLAEDTWDRLNRRTSHDYRMQKLQKRDNDAHQRNHINSFETERRLEQKTQANQKIVQQYCQQASRKIIDKMSKSIARYGAPVKLEYVYLCANPPLGYLETLRGSIKEAVRKFPVVVQFLDRTDPQIRADILIPFIYHGSFVIYPKPRRDLGSHDYLGDKGDDSFDDRFCQLLSSIKSDVALVADCEFKSNNEASGYFQLRIVVDCMELYELIPVNSKIYRVKLEED